MARKIQKGLAAIALLMMFISGVAFADPLPVRVYATDTVAGYSTTLRTSQLRPGDDVIFVVEKPDGGVIRAGAVADPAGIAQTEFFGHHTKKAGTYKVAMTYPNSSKASPQNTFQVVADKPSFTQSMLTSTQQMVAADGKEETFVTVALFDAYRNPVKAHQIKLISSRSDDEIEVLQTAVTDEGGKVNFRVMSPFPGISVFSAIDVTLSQVLEDREEVVFFAPTSASRAIGGSFLSADVLESGSAPATPPDLSGPVDHFEITDLPAMVKVGEEQYFTITARDNNNAVARNYTGTVLISVPEDENATLPNNGEYTFKASDQGKFTFNLALQFSKVGKQVVQVFDKNDWKISGEMAVEVVPAQAVIPDASGEGLKIKSPADGAELGSNLIILTGQGDPNINLKVFDNDLKIGDTETDLEGFFNFQAKELDNGMHAFYVMSESGTVSPVVHVKIDILPPVIDRFEIFPEGVVDPGTPVTITVYSEPQLATAQVRLQGVEQPMEEQMSEPGSYSITVKAPSAPGNFPVDVILADALANKAELLNRATILVQEVKQVAPPQAQGLNGQAGDSQVILSWDPVIPADKPIQKYRISMGSTFTDLTQTVDTPDSQTTYTIGSLENDHQTFFAVSAVDSGGLVGERSVVIAVTPKAAENLNAVSPVVETIHESSLRGEPMDGGVTLFWDPVPDPRVYGYRVYFGLRSGAYDDSVTTSSLGTTAAVSDLINGVPYYFAIAAVDLGGREISSLTNEARLIPGVSAFRPAAPSFSSVPDFQSQLRRVPRTDQTGSEALWVVLASLFAAGFLYGQRRRITSSRRP